MIEIIEMIALFSDDVCYFSNDVFTSLESLMMIKKNKHFKPKTSSGLKKGSNWVFGAPVGSIL